MNLDENPHRTQLLVALGSISLVVVILVMLGHFAALAPQAAFTASANQAVNP